MAGTLAHHASGSNCRLSLSAAISWYCVSRCTDGGGGRRAWIPCVAVCEGCALNVQGHPAHHPASHPLHSTLSPHPTCFCLISVTAFSVKYPEAVESTKLMKSSAAAPFS